MRSRLAALIVGLLALAAIPAFAQTPSNLTLFDAGGTVRTMCAWQGVGMQISCVAVEGYDGSNFHPILTDGAGRTVVDINGTVPVTGTFFQSIQPVSASSLPLPAGAATSANQASVIAAPGSNAAQAVAVEGITGALPVSVAQSDTSSVGNTINSGTANLAYTFTVANGEGVAAISVTGLTASGAALALEGSNDGGTTWSAINEIANGTGPQGSTLTADGQFRISVAGRTKVRLRVSTPGTGTITISSNVSVASSVVAMVTALPSGANPIGSISQTGTAGADYSANKPTLPTVGSTFGGTGPFANYVLVATVPALATRNNVEIDNSTGAQIAVVRDDGTAAGGASPVNASVFPLAGGTSAGLQGGAWSSQTFKGRLQVYAPAALSGSAFVNVMVD